MSIEFVLRLIGMIVFAIGGGYLGAFFSQFSDQPKEMYVIVIGLVGAMAGIILTPFLTTRPARMCNA